MSLWQLNTQKLVDNKGVWYFYSNTWYGDALDAAGALALARALLDAERALMLARDGATETYSIGVKRPGEPATSMVTQGVILPGLRPDMWGDALAPCEVSALVLFPGSGGSGRKWYRPGLTWDAWSAGPLDPWWGVAYAEYVAGVEAIRPALYLPNGDALPPPASVASFTHYRLRHGTRRQARPVF